MVPVKPAFAICWSMHQLTFCWHTLTNHKIFLKPWDLKIWITLKNNLKHQEMVQVLLNVSVLLSEPSVIHVRELCKALKLSSTSFTWKVPHAWAKQDIIHIENAIFVLNSWRTQRCFHYFTEWDSHNLSKGVNLGVGKKMPPTCTNIHLFLEFLVILSVTYFFISKEDSCSITSQI